MALPMKLEILKMIISNSSSKSLNIGDFIIHRHNFFGMKKFKDSKYKNRKKREKMYMWEKSVGVVFLKK